MTRTHDCGLCGEPGHKRQTCPAGADARGRRLAQSFWARVRKSNGCWEWTGAGADRGTPQFRSSTGRVSAQWFALWLDGKNPAPGSAVVRACRNSKCVRPGHCVEVGGAAGAGSAVAAPLRDALVLLLRLRGGRARLGVLATAVSRNQQHVWTALSRLAKRGVVRNVGAGLYELTEATGA